MGQNILTQYQKAVLELAVKDPEITSFYYFTGGTALAVFYLKHRFSEDLDFFTESAINVVYLKNLFTKNRDKLQAVTIKTKELRGLLFFYLTFQDGSQLRVDFVNFENRRLERGTRYKDLTIDSIFDIAVNKLYTISDRTRARDFIDLYFILKTQGISLEQVYNRIIDKYTVHFDTLELGRKLTYIVDAKDYPIMLVPFNKEEMIKFFLSEAKKLKPKIFK